MKLWSPLLAGVTLLAQSSGITSAGYSAPAPLVAAPGQIVTLFVQGLTVTLKDPIRAPQGPLPLSLGGITATLTQGPITTPAPIVEVRASGALTAVTVQIPYELQPLCPLCLRPVVSPVQIAVFENGRGGTPIDIVALGQNIHILTACDVAVPGFQAAPPAFHGIPCQPLVTHVDGSLVTANQPARANETLVAYAFGLGATDPPTATGQVPSEARTASPLSLFYDFRVNAGVTRATTAVNAIAPVYAGLVPGYPGLYQINFPVLGPTVALTPCTPGGLGSYVAPDSVQSNLTVSFGSAFSVDAAAICVAP